MPIYSFRLFLHRTVHLLGILPLLALSGTNLSSCSIQDDDYIAPSEKDNIIHIGDALPQFTVTDSEGNEISTPDLLGRTSVLVFFNTACGDCQRELPVIQRVYEEYGNKVRFLCISREEEEASVRTFWERHSLTLPYSAQPDASVYSLFALRTIPRIYVSDAAGVVRHMFIENINEEILRQNLDNLQEEKQPNPA